MTNGDSESNGKVDGESVEVGINVENAGDGCDVIILYTPVDG